MILLEIQQIAIIDKCLLCCGNAYWKTSQKFIYININMFFEWKILNTVDIRYLKYPLSRTFIMSNFLFGPFSILINFPYKSARYLERRYLELSLCRTIFSVPSVIFGLFAIGSLEHSNDVFEWIIPFISGIPMLLTALTKLCSEVCSFFFSKSFQAMTCPQLSDNSV